MRGSYWFKHNCQYLVLLLLDLLYYDGYSITTGIAPAGDIRAHIFRTLEFVPGLLGGDYTSIQYHGYAFLAGYGIGFYSLTFAISSALRPLVASFQAATIACNLMWVLTPFILALAVIMLADELGATKYSHLRLMQGLFGAVILLFPGVVQTSLLGADPYLLSFSFSIVALAYGLRSKNGHRALLGLLIFSALSIYVESFGYLLVGMVFLGLLATRRPVLRVIPALAAITAFSWVQLLQVSGFMAPYIETHLLVMINFLPFFGMIAILVCAYSYAVFLLRDRLDEKNQAIYVIVSITLVVAAVAIARALLGWDFGILDSVIDGILPWRLLFVNIPVLLLASVYAWGSRLAPRFSMQKVMIVISVVLISTPFLLGAYPVVFSPMPSASSYQQLNGKQILVIGDALSIPYSPVAYSAAFNYSTVSGPFSQGDPSFYALTVYYEWSSSLTSNKVSVENLMRLTGADELINSSGPLETNCTYEWQGYAQNGSSSYQAAAVTPILVEAPNSTDALDFALFTNLLGRNGYKLDFVTAAPSSEIYGVVVLPGYQGPTPSGVPTYVVQNDSVIQDSRKLFVNKSFIDTPYLALPPVTSNAIDAASSVATTLISFFNPTYIPVVQTTGQNYYSVSSNISLPIQLSKSYYPYFLPANYSQNVYHFILLPRPESITWHLPFYELTGLVSLSAVLVFVALRKRALFLTE
jgi:hypothetical protein